MIKNTKHYPPLIVRKKPIDDPALVRATGIGDYNRDGFKPYFDENDPHTLVVPTIAISEKLILNYFSAPIRGKNVVINGGYRNLIEVEMSYKTGAIRKIERIFKIEIQKENDNQHPHPIEFYRQEIKLRFDASPDVWRWIIVSDSLEKPNKNKNETTENEKQNRRNMTPEELWESIYEEQEEEQKSILVNEINVAFESVFDAVLTTKEGEAYSDTLDRSENVILAVAAYVQKEFDFGYIDAAQHKLFCDEIQESKEKLAAARLYLQQTPKYHIRPTIQDERHMLHQDASLFKTGNHFMDKLRESIERMITKPAYYVDINAWEIYPNVAEYYAQKQFSAVTRNASTRREQKAELLKKAKIAYDAEIAAGKKAKTIKRINI
ncbi:hypothetical protein PUW24_26505 (plasmid) [Paenibacillus urinalis]|uniref:Uncharacterized protein n=1 Tax=Paenibacillus urinalis TaxID=521520 RepID=A0AAX3N8A3_9BACL|nr:hypothetical protein [Paenibacillus urinalis]WDH85531.1 hypothetical protein PUW23_26705 [Paenibacillus urinalis]WDI00121.1 hypothetical protein PUW24_26555 [Paenibacillus urinalis]WDI00134.1 hypothetical protein PUW24_26505 [Paenibacillus urinalis]WDI05432.1 hypothetical protein PUW25_27375 [Paenibacillus urinalis]